MAGFITAVGVACLSTNKRIGGAVFMRGNGCCSHTLNAEAPKCSNKNFLICGTFSLVGAHGSLGMTVGSKDLSGH